MRKKASNFPTSVTCWCRANSRWQAGPGISSQIPMSAVCFSAVSEHSIKRAQELVSDRLQEIAHPRATAGLQEHHDGHSRHQLQAAKPPSLATGQRQPDFIVSCIATGLPI